MMVRLDDPTPAALSKGDRVLYVGKVYRVASLEGSFTLRLRRTFKQWVKDALRIE
jgi:hypothetical protein